MRSILSFIAVVACAQEIMPGVGAGGAMRLRTSDSSVLDAKEPRSDLPCIVTPVQPELMFDLRFHVGYMVSIPMKELEGAKNTLTILFRVLPESRAHEPVYFVQKFQVPEMAEGTNKGMAGLEGAFRVGEGKYRIEWLMRDQNERLCASFWDLDARANAGDNLLPGSIVANSIEAQDQTLFSDELSVARAQPGRSLHVKVMVNFDPQNSPSVSLGNIDLEGVAGILRKIMGEPSFGQYSIVVYSIQAQQVLYRQEAAAHIDLPALGKSLRSLDLGTVDLKKLQAKNSETSFLENLVAEEMTKQHVDAVFFVGPKFYLDANVSHEVVDRLRQPDSPVFYLNYNPHPLSSPWRDAIGKIVHRLQGTEYTVSRPRDLCNAWPEIVQRILKRKSALQSSSGTF